MEEISHFDLVKAFGYIEGSSNQIFFSLKITILLHTCTSWSKLPSYKSTLNSTKHLLLTFGLALVMLSFNSIIRIYTYIYFLRTEVVDKSDKKKNNSWIISRNVNLLRKGIFLWQNIIQQHTNNLYFIKFSGKSYIPEI